MAQYGRRWWAVLAVVVGLLGGLLLTYPGTSDPAGLDTLFSRPGPTEDGYCDSFLGADLAALRNELAVFSEEPFTVTSFGGVPIEVRVPTQEQADFVRRVVGQDVNRLVEVLVTDDLGRTIPEDGPASTYELSNETAQELRRTLFRIIQHEDGGGHHVRVFPSGRINVALQDETYLTLARRLLGPDVNVQEFIGQCPSLGFEAVPIDELGIEIPFDRLPGVSDLSHPSGRPVLVASGVGVLVLLFIGSRIGDLRRRQWRRRPLGGWFVGLGAVLVALAFAADPLEVGHSGFGWLQVATALLGVVVILDGLFDLAGGWRRAAIVWSLVLLGVLAVTHQAALELPFSHVAHASVEIKPPTVTALPLLEGSELAEFADREALIIESFRNPPRRGLLLIQPPDAAVEARALTDAYPLEFEVRYFARSQELVDEWAADFLGDYLEYREAGRWQEPRGTTTGMVSSIGRWSDPRAPRSVAVYASGAALLLMVLPWDWWRRPSDSRPHSPPPAPRKPQLTGAGA